MPTQHSALPSGSALNRASASAFSSSSFTMSSPGSLDPSMRDDSQTAHSRNFVRSIVCPRRPILRTRDPCCATERSKPCASKCSPPIANKSLKRIRYFHRACVGGELRFRHSGLVEVLFIRKKIRKLLTNWHEQLRVNSPDNAGESSPKRSALIHVLNLLHSHDGFIDRPIESLQLA